MYQPHDPLGLIICALLCAIVIAVSSVLQRKRELKSQAVAVLFGVGFIGFILLTIGITAYDDYKLREELRGIPPDRMMHVRLFKGESSREIVAPSDVGELMSRIQSLKNVAAHHSHPADPFEIAFGYGGRQYQYKIGQESARPNEYWVDAVDRKDDIGRIRSGDLGQIVQRLLAGKP